MAHNSDPIPASELRRVHEHITEHGYALTSEWDIGLPLKCGKNLQETYFDGGQLRHDKGDMPRDRERARDVILYEWNDGELTLQEYETIAIWDRSDIKGERIHKRIKLLQDRQARDLIETFLSLVPEKRRKPGVRSGSTCSGPIPTSSPSHIRIKRTLLYFTSWTGKVTARSRTYITMIQRRMPRKSASRFCEGN